MPPESLSTDFHRRRLSWSSSSTSIRHSFPLYCLARTAYIHVVTVTNSLPTVHSIIRSPSPHYTPHDVSQDLVSCMFLFPSLATSCSYRDSICFAAVMFHFHSVLLAYPLIPPFLYHPYLRSIYSVSISCTDPLRVYNLFPAGIYLRRIPRFSP